MGNHNNIWMIGEVHFINNRTNPRSSIIPAFSFWRANVARCFPVPSGQVRIPLGNLSKVHPVPNPKIKFAQCAGVFMAVSARLNRVPGFHRTLKV